MCLIRANNVLITENDVFYGAKSITNMAARNAESGILIGRWIMKVSILKLIELKIHVEHYEKS